ncbi:MAG: ABC transporter ATP-binding protein [Candidatus Woesearchaeota archaeon]|nr:MAG: ABC transporter ATP-binding protein [Candidatus Woesearchaeota archaeon]
MKLASPLRTKKVAFGYRDAQVLKDVSLHIKSSQIVAVVGTSGSGKSTFLKLLTGVISSGHEGSIKIFGLGSALAKQDIAYIPQEVSLFPDLTLEENISFFGSLYGLSKQSSLHKGKELLALLNMRVPLTRKPTELSGGQRVRLNIVVSLLHDPKVIILDEPFVGLDYKNRKLLWHILLSQKNRRKTVILTTHLLSEAEHHADQLVVLHQGKILAKGKIDALKQKLKTAFIAEVKFSGLTKRDQQVFHTYCAQHDITILDEFGSYAMVSLASQGQRNYLLRFLEKEGLGYEELSFREPSLDELFLQVEE